MRGSELPHRRYSMPEAIMRKFRLGQSSASSSENSSRSSTRQRRHVPRRKQQKPKPSPNKVDRSSQTSRPSLETPSSFNLRTSSVPDLSSSESDERRFQRPVSGTPSPYRICYGPEHSCALCSASWSVASSDCTLNQTVSDRTTSTQDSTLSVQSSSPNTPTPLPFTAEQKSALEDEMFRPAGRFIAVHSESVVIRPIQIVESTDNWRFGFSTDDVDSLPRDRSTSIDQLPDLLTTELNSFQHDRSTSIDLPSQSVPFQTTSTSTQSQQDLSPPTPPKLKNDVGTQIVETRSCLSKSKSYENVKDHQQLKHKKIQFSPQLKNSKSFPPTHKNPDLSVTGGNYKDYKEETAIARFSAVPRSNSMIVNTSSNDYTSDSDLSLTDSLEDGIDNQFKWPESRHDNRPVRGEVALRGEDERRRCAKSGDAYAYFLSLTGEQGTITEWALPDWLRARLRRREEEIKKLCRVKFGKRQTVVYRRRKKTMRRLDLNSPPSSRATPKNCKSIKWPSGNESTIVGVVQQVPQSPIVDKTQNLPSSDENGPSFVQISEVIKIEMSNQLKTVITKEKQIHLNRDAFLSDKKGVQSSEIINNADAHSSQKIIMRTNVGHCESISDVKKCEVEAGTQTANCVVPQDCRNRSLFGRPKDGGYSFKQFRPLFRSKADDQTVADVLLDALKEDDVKCGRMVENSSNTCAPYLSESSQTGVEELEEERRLTSDKSEQCDEESLRRTEIVVTDDKQSNTEAFSVAAVAQTRETFNVDDVPFVQIDTDEITVVSQLAVDKSTDVFEDPTTSDKSCNTVNPLTNSSAQTETPSDACDPKPKRDVQFADDNVRQSTKARPDKTSRPKRDVPTTACSRNNGNPDILELNVPPCACHMCTFHKKNKTAPEQRRRVLDLKDKKSTKFPTSRRNPGKFTRKFEAIPEEKAGSTESVAEEGRGGASKTTTTTTTGTMTKGEMRHASVQEPPPTEEKVDDGTQTIVQNDASAQTTLVPADPKKSSLVVGRFRALQDKAEEEEESSSSGGLSRLTEGLEVVRQYKGRAALAASAATGHEELLTLSKGWINFYLLKDNHELEEAAEEGFRLDAANIDETIHQYTLEIQATPEPGFHTATSQTNLPVLPNISPHGVVKKRHKSSQMTASSRKSQVTILPEIYSSSSSSTPENQPKDSRRHSRKQARATLPELGEVRSARHEIKARREKREQITAISKTELPAEVDRALEAHSSHSARAVEVARSEHSVSSITSSTVIMSESPSPQQLRYSARKVQKRTAMFTEHNGIGSSWTVTVAGSSGASNQTPPDVEMRLTFAKPSLEADDKSEPKSFLQYNSKQTHHVSRSKRQDKMIEEYKHSLHNERHSVQYVPEMRSVKKERGKLDIHRKTPNDDEISGRLSPRSKCSEILSEDGELQVTGLAITPELKPRVPTQSERDLVRRQRYKFTR